MAKHNGFPQLAKMLSPTFSVTQISASNLPKRGLFNTYVLMHLALLVKRK